MRLLDSLFYIIGNHSDGLLRECESFIDVISSFLINIFLMPMFGGRSPDWLGEPR